MKKTKMKRAVKKEAPVVSRPAQALDGMASDTARVSCPSWMAFDHLACRAVNANEQTSLAALIAYVAFQSGLPEYRIERLFADRFSIPNAKCLPAEMYDCAIRYLVDMVGVSAA